MSKIWKVMIANGGGPCGLSTGLALQVKGLSYVFIEKEAISQMSITNDFLRIGNIPYEAKMIVCNRNFRYV
ncbi:hypothetical protein [Viridibacillus arvi]|uniref:Uncharacterized protein n=1 Tax=Viridibacillus arvi TaxID=263475 RepID=A0A0M0LK83_9BACL|nr:hypothetical protein [Viridibacillus arvi]KOO51470.1 hypothetical protein AMD00_03060 [Viridibacillus arvi]